MSKLENIIEKITEICSVSTIHGIPNFLKSQRFLIKSIWLISTLISTGVCLWFTCDSILNYYEYPITTSINIKYQSPTPFPTISMCSKYWADPNIYNSKTNIKETIISCNLFWTIDCKKDAENYFVWYYDDLLFNCIRFNSGRNASGHSVPILNSTAGGYDDGLKIEINASAGLAIWVHEPSTPPKNKWWINRNGNMNIALQGLETHFVFEKVIDKKQTNPYNKCLEDVELFQKNQTIIDYINSLNRTLNRDLCVDISFAIDYIEKNPCNCTTDNVTLSDLWEKCVAKGSKYSVIKKTDECSIKYYRDVFLSQLVNIYCPQECETTSYVVDTKLFGTANKVKFAAYYKDLKYTVINQNPDILLNDLISNIGGIIGVFLGISFLSFIEIIELTFEILIILFEVKKKSQKVNLQVTASNAILVKPAK